jgi:Na+/proline symporter
MVPSSLIWAAAQIRAFGHVLAISSNFSVTVGVTVAALVVIFYTLLGGMWGDVATDFIQGIVLILGMGLLMVAAVHSLGGLSETLSLIDPAKLNFVGAGEGKWQRLDSWMIPILGSLTAQELIARVISSRSANVARNASLSAAAIYLLVGLIPVWLGLLGSHFNLKLDDPDQFLPAIASSLLPSALFVVFCGALISAILSTVDSALLAVSALVANNIVVPLRGSNLSEPQKIWTARLVVLIAGVFAYVMALYAQGIYSLVEAASSFGSAGVLIITLFGLFSRFGGHWSASGALIAGLVTTPLAQYVWPIEAPFIVSIVVALLTYVLAELVRRLLVLQQSKRAAGVIGAPTKVFSK